MRGAVTRPNNITGTGIGPKKTVTRSKNITGTGIRPKNITNSSTCNIFWSYSSTCNIFWSCYYPPQNFHLVLLRPPYLCLVLLQSSVFGLITTPYFWSYYATPIEPYTIIIMGPIMYGHNIVVQLHGFFVPSTLSSRSDFCTLYVPPM
jgi:hypothetical protein